MKKRSRDSDTAMVPYREDCWSEGETTSLIDTWGARHEALNRRNLSREDWEEVASAVSSRHGSSRWRTAIQCKNRMGTLKKRYKVEKAASSSGNSRWPFYSSIDNLISIIGVKPFSSSSSSLPARNRSTGRQVRKKKAVKEDHSISPPPTLYNYLQVVTMLASDNPSVWEKPFDWTQDPDQIPQARKYCLELAEREERLERDRKMNPTVDLDENKRKLLSTQRLRQFIEGQIGHQN